MQIIWIDICRGINGKKNSWHSSQLEQKKDEVEQATHWDIPRRAIKIVEQLSSRKVGK